MKIDFFPAFVGIRRSEWTMPESGTTYERYEAVLQWPDGRTDSLSRQRPTMKEAEDDLLACLMPPREDDNG